MIDMKDTRHLRDNMSVCTLNLDQSTPIFRNILLVATGTAGVSSCSLCVTILNICFSTPPNLSCVTPNNTALFKFLALLPFFGINFGVCFEVIRHTFFLLGFCLYLCSHNHNCFHVKQTFLCLLKNAVFLVVWTVRELGECWIKNQKTTVQCIASCSNEHHLWTIDSTC